ncbi:orotidine-5'-phosphate decarboxylase [Candidatus Micrarchaeota archaeon]|nr:orotidine-5'-phosphate decarboxylase [Candidatus Micrarchaeota archaeon]
MVNMSMLERMIKRANECRTILCFGIDPQITRIPNYEIATGRTVQQTIAPYFEEITDRLLEENQISAIKPNYAYFAQYGFDGLFVLKDIIQRYKNKVPVILDAKRGDIGKTCEAYAKEAYEFWDADAITIAPYMGSDSILPFLRDDRLVYVLCKTSNPSSKEFEDLKIAKEELYLKVARKAMEWNTGLVVGATSNAIKKIVKITKNEVPFLIPGIGSQGGDLELVMKAISKNPQMHRINASSSIAYAHEKKGGRAPDAAVKESEGLNKIIRRHM